MQPKSRQLLTAAAAAALLCAGSVSRAQEEPKPPVMRAEPAPAKTLPAKTPAAATSKSTTTPATKPAAPPGKTPGGSPAKSPATPAKTRASATPPAATPAAKSAAASQPPAQTGGQPAKIRICDPDNAGWCWTYTRNGDHYDGVGEHGGDRTLTLETFTTGSVVMRVTQAGKPGWSSVNSGRMSGNGIELGEWSDNAGHKGRITASWDTVTQSASGEAKPAATPPAPKRAGAGAHTNVETTEGLEKRAAVHTKPTAATAEPATEPPR